MNSNGERTMELADCWRRLAARCVDTIILSAVAFVAFLVTVIIVLFNDPDFLLTSAGYDSRPAPYWLAFVVPLPLVITYEMALTAKWGQTLGKRAAQIKVVDLYTGLAPGISASVIRWLIPTAPVLAGYAMTWRVNSAVPLVGGVVLWLLVYASSLRDRNWQGWHDKAARTVVVMAADESRAKSAGAGDSREL